MAAQISSYQSKTLCGWSRDPITHYHCCFTNIHAWKVKYYYHDNNKMVLIQYKVIFKDTHHHHFLDHLYVWQYHLYLVFISIYMCNLYFFYFSILVLRHWPSPPSSYSINTNTCIIKTSSTTTTFTATRFFPSATTTHIISTWTFSKQCDWLFCTISKHVGLCQCNQITYSTML